MKVTFHHRFYEVYTADPAAARGRMESMVAALEGTDAFIEPQPAPDPDLARVHGAAHLQRIQANPPVDAVGRLAACRLLADRKDRDAYAVLRPCS